jgi:hypothetical protein
VAPGGLRKEHHNVLLAAASLTGGRDILASKLVTLTLQAGTQNPTQLAETLVRLPERLLVSPKTEIVRVVIQSPENGRIGAAELDSKCLNAARQAPTPEPALIARPQRQEAKTAPPQR